MANGALEVGMFVVVGKEKYEIVDFGSDSIKTTRKSIKFYDITDIQEGPKAKKGTDEEVDDEEAGKEVKKRAMTKTAAMKKVVEKPMITEYGVTDVEIKKVLAQVHPTNKLRQDTIEEIKGIVQKLFTKLRALPAYDEDIQTVLPGELGKHASGEVARVHIPDRARVAVFHTVDDRHTNTILEYIVAELLELSGNCAHDFHKVIITPEHLKKAIANDPELVQMMAIINDKMYEFTWKYGDRI